MLPVKCAHGGRKATLSHCKKLVVELPPCASPSANLKGSDDDPLFSTRELLAEAFLLGWLPPSRLKNGEVCHALWLCAIRSRENEP